MPAGESKKPFAVHASVSVHKLYLELQMQAMLEGRGDETLAAYRQIMQRLRTDPFEFGEPLYPLRHLRLHMRNCSLRPLVVEFAVSAEHHMVFIKTFRLMSAELS